jgi:hypothetical protein
MLVLNKDALFRCVTSPKLTKARMVAQSHHEIANAIAKMHCQLIEPLAKKVL